MTGRVVLFAAALLATVMPAAAQSVTFVARHGERADATGAPGSMMASDPDLSAAGHARAEALAVALKDARITAIFVTSFKRTQQTAAPLAKSLGLTPVVVDAKEPIAALAKRIAAHDGNVLVVGHSNTVPEVVQALGGGPSFKIADDEFDNLFVVTRGATPSVIRLHYR